MAVPVAQNARDVTIETGRRLLDYRLVEKIGEGGMGEVWKAVDTSLDLATMEQRRLTRFDDTATMRTFDVTAIVFDRRRENSDIVLIELEGGAR
jgi:serine/threonine protein kinase